VHVRCQLDGLQVSGEPQTCERSDQGSDSDDSEVAEGGEIQVGRQYMQARWCSLLGEGDDGGRKYEKPSGESFELPLDACLFCDVNNHIKYERTCFRVDNAAVTLLDAELAALAKSTN